MRWICLTLDLKANRALFENGDLPFFACRSIRSVRTEALLTFGDPWPDPYSYWRTLRWPLPDFLNAKRNTDAPAAGEV
jgi:hypothetical protein